MKFNLGYWWRCNLCCMLKNMNILSISFSQVPCFLTVSFPMYLFQACLKNWYPFVYLLNLRFPLISHHLHFKTCMKSAFLTLLFSSLVFILPLPSALARKSHDHSPLMPLILIQKENNSLSVDNFWQFIQHHVWSKFCS